MIMDGNGKIDKYWFVFVVYMFVSCWPMISHAEKMHVSLLKGSVFPAHEQQKTSEVWFSAGFVHA